jgi:hypothetical protein
MFQSGRQQHTSPLNNAAYKDPIGNPGTHIRQQFRDGLELALRQGPGGFGLQLVPDSVNDFPSDRLQCFSFRAFWCAEEFLQSPQ